MSFGKTIIAYFFDSYLTFIQPQDVVTLSVKSKTLEAIVGAVYHERGLNAAKEFVKKHVLV